MSRNERTGRVKHAVRFPLLLPLGATVLEPNLWHQNVNEAARKERTRRKETKLLVKLSAD